MNILSNILKKFLIKIIKIYNFFSPFFYKNVCRFTPPCSQYAIKSISKYGPVIGTYKSFIRILKCNPFGNHGNDPVGKKIIK